MTPPTFVVAGQPNEGKTTLVATLTEDEKACVGPIAGTTRESREYKVIVDGVVKFVLYDTPGFENPGELLDWFRAYSADHENPAAAYLNVPEHRHDYPVDCEILKPIAEKAAVIHVVNPGRELRPEDEFEAEIFRLCKVPRVGLMNSRRGGADHRKEWVDLMTTRMNTWREFNACEAIFADRIKLFEAFMIAVPEWEQQMRDVVNSLEEQWNARLAGTASTIVHTLRDAVKIQIFEPFDGKHELEAAKHKADKAVRNKLGKLEEEFRHHVREVFRHGPDHWTAGETLELDLFDETVWQLFGFSKKTLVIAGALAGGGIAVLIDIAMGGGTFGIVALVGAFVGGVATYYSADKAVELSLPGIGWGRFKIPGRKLGGVSLRAGIERRSKLPGILLDRMCCYAVAAGCWAHGRRPETPGSSNLDQESKITRALEESKEASRLQSLIELWHRSRDRDLGGKGENAVREAEEWLQSKMVEHLRAATCRK